MKARKTMEMTMNKPEQNGPIRRVGSFTLGACLIAAGIFFLFYYFVPHFDWMLVLKIAPALAVILLGIEVLYFASKPERWKYDFLSVFFCLILILGCFALMFVPTLMAEYSPEQTQRRNELFDAYRTEVYEDFKQEATNIQIRNMYGGLNNYYSSADTLEELAKENGKQDIYLRIELEEAYPTAESFAADCRTLMNIVQKQTIQPYEVTFESNMGSQRWYIDLQDTIQQDWTEVQMVEQIKKNQQYDDNLDNAESDSLDEENEAEVEVDAEEEAESLVVVSSSTPV